MRNFSLPFPFPARRKQACSRGLGPLFIAKKIFHKHDWALSTICPLCNALNGSKCQHQCLCGLSLIRANCLASEAADCPPPGGRGPLLWAGDLTQSCGPKRGESQGQRVIHHKAGIQKPMGKHQFGPAMAGGRTVLLRDRGDEEPARHREDPAHPAQRKAGGGAQGAGAQRLSSYSCLCWGCASLSWRGQSTAPAGWETGPLVVQVNLLAPGIQMMALLQTITELLCLASAGGSWTHYLPSDVPFHLQPGSACKGNTQPDTSKTGGGGGVCTGRVIKMLLFLGEKLAT